MCFRFAFRALLLAGRAPWFDFFRVRWGFAIIDAPVWSQRIQSITNATVQNTMRQNAMEGERSAAFGS